MWNVNVVTNRFDDRSHDRRASVTVSHNGFLAIVARLSTWTAGSIPGTSGVEVRFSARVIFATCIYPAQRRVNYPLNRIVARTTLRCLAMAFAIHHTIYFPTRGDPSVF